MRTVTGPTRTLSGAFLGLGRMRICTVRHDVKRRPGLKPEDRSACEERFDFGEEFVFFPVDARKALVEGELRPAEGFEFPDFPTVA